MQWTVRPVRCTVKQLNTAAVQCSAVVRASSQLLSVDGNIIRPTRCMPRCGCPAVDRLPSVVERLELMLQVFDGHKSMQ